MGFKFEFSVSILVKNLCLEPKIALNFKNLQYFLDDAVQGQYLSPILIELRNSFGFIIKLAIP